MAPGALGSNIGDLRQQQRLATRPMHRMALVARDRIFGMAAGDAADLLLIAMAAEAGIVGLNHWQLRWQPDVFGIGAFCVFCPRTMARLTSHPGPTPRVVGLKRKVERLSKSIVKIFVTQLTCVRTGVTRL